MDKVKRCPRGTRRNKKTGTCEIHHKQTRKVKKQIKKKTPKNDIDQNEIYVLDLAKLGRKRCPTGMQRIKGTTLCRVKKENKKSQTIKDTPTYKDSLEDLMMSYNKNKLNQVIPYECFKSSNIMMFLHLIERNPKTACLYNILRIGSLESRKNRLYFKSKTHRKRFTEDIKTQYEQCKKHNKLLCIPLVLHFPEGTHMNMIILNPFRNELERFEPHGSDTLLDGFTSTPLHRDLRSFAYDIDLMLQFVPSHKICPIGFKGYQAYDSEEPLEHGISNNIQIRDPGGFCCAWSYFYADLRLKYPRLPGSEIIQRSTKIIGQDPRQFRLFIRGQVQFLSELFQKSGIKTKYEDYMKMKRRKRPEHKKQASELDKQWGDYVWSYFGSYVRNNMK